MYLGKPDVSNNQFSMANAFSNYNRGKPLVLSKF